VLTGSCLCGGVSYRADATLGPIIHCHCESCRKAHGAAFSSLGGVPRDKFSWTSGEELLTKFESSPGKFRYFCSRCGSQMISDRPHLDKVYLRLGCLDTEVTNRPTVHIWRSDGASWYDPNEQTPEVPKGLPAG
jgi:hypothetical protein